MKSKDAGKVKTLTYSGEISLSEVGTLAEEIKSALAEADQVRVDLVAVDDVDLSVLQLLCSAHRSAAGVGKHLILDGAISAGLSRKVVDAGFHRHLGCSFVNGHNCIWTDQLSH